MESTTMFIPKSHYKEISEALTNFNSMVTSVKEVPPTEGIDEEYVQIEMMIPDYSTLYYMGYAVGSHTMSEELMPIMKRSEAKLLHLHSKVNQLTWIQQTIDKYKNENK